MLVLSLSYGATFIKGSTHGSFSEILPYSRILRKAELVYDYKFAPDASEFQKVDALCSVRLNALGNIVVDPTTK